MIFRRSVRPILLFIMAIMLWDPNSVCRAEVASPEFFELTRTVVTPHIPWAVPLAGGPVRVLVIAPRIYQRDTIELAQRLELDYEYLMLYSSGPDVKPVFGRGKRGLGGKIEGTTTQDLLDEFRQKIDQEYDCIILGGIHKWDDMPPEFLYKLFAKVSAGTGLVLTAEKNRTKDVISVLRRATRLSDGKRFITAGVPYQGLATLETRISSRAALAAAVDLRRLDQGRIAILNELIPHTYSNQVVFLSPMPAEHRWNEYVERDYYLALAAKAVLWAANREPTVQIQALGLAGAQGDGVPQVDPLKSAAAVRVQTTGAAAMPLTVTWTIRDTKGNEIATDKGVLDDAGTSELRLSGELPAARYFVDCWLKADEKVVDWGSTLVDVVHDQGVAEVRADAASLEPGKQLTLTFALRQPATAGTLLHCEVEGPFDRVVARDEVQVAEGATEARWTYTHRDPISHIVRITGGLLEAASVRERQSIEIPVRLPVPSDDMAAITWQCLKGDHFVNQILRRRTLPMGDNMAFAGFMSNVPAWKSARLQAWNNWPTIAYVRHYGYGREGANPSLVRRPYCLTDPHYLESERNRVHAVVKALAPYGVIYNLGDENTLGNSDICWSPTCLTYFRNYLRRTYSDLDALNQEWGTAYKRWVQVMPLELAQARSSGQYARWADHRASMDSVWADNFRRGGKLIHELDPGARFGFESHGGGEEWYLGFDYTKCFKGISYVAGNIYEFIPSQTDPGTFTGGAWYGGPPVESTMQLARNPWWDVARGFHVTHRFADFGAEGDGPYDLFTPDLRPYPGYVALVRETDILMRGVAKLLFMSKKPRPEIASVYSRPSILANGLFAKSLRHSESRPELPVPWRHMGYDALDDGRLLADDCKVVLLAGCYAVSKKGAVTLEEFVNNGGTVIADILPAVLDSHCMPVADGGLLARLFGISAQGHIEKIQFVKAKVAGKLGLQEPLTFAEVAMDPGLALAGAKAHGDSDGTPVCMINASGKGRAVLLNMGFTSLKSRENRAGWLVLATRILDQAGVSPPQAISGPDAYGSPVGDRRPRAIFYEDGSHQYALVITQGARESGAAASAESKFAFAREGHLYLPRSGKYLGRGKQVTLPAGGPPAQLVACLAYRVAGIEASVPKTVRQGETCELQVGVRAHGNAEPQRHVVHVAVYDPTGQQQRHYRQNVVASQGRAAVAIPFTLNETPGKWQILLTEVATGSHVERRVEMRSRLR